MPFVPDAAHGLRAHAIDQFIARGFVRIDQAFSPETARAAREILWRDLPGTPDDPSGWRQPVVRLGHYAQPPFQEAARSPVLERAFDQLVGPGRWQRLGALGTFPVRFPLPDDPGDTGWHIDVSFGTDAPDFLDWRANVFSRGRALLLLFLFSDVGIDDAPTRIRVGSHVDIARALAPAGDAGLTLRELAAGNFGGSDGRPEVPAVGRAGSVYLCHPFLVHSARAHRGSEPRFLAQPPLLPADPAARVLRADGDTPIERAIR
ncbi:phytanoyl-CoA dioxygenase family protein [Sphingomonas sanxanigenens]|uniref:Phytanoyl-CoA dioxygenase n=1 Tax=Sphingomonas sanxanigenens DSM 19645 = NX02 TaxID=1123269 RepID=W0AHF2_9SPHN|nr:phytanoyl-CoA dioxygenase family protein [Sphingomonas sanxanigenens]AHE56526.1 hypothetical protein NX02_24595 [Sphingomonas sanxanigenens DSM 19645 = NX02]